MKVCKEYHLNGTSIPKPKTSGSSSSSKLTTFVQIYQDDGCKINKLLVLSVSNLQIQSLSALSFNVHCPIGDMGNLNLYGSGPGRWEGVIIKNIFVDVING